MPDGRLGIGIVGCGRAAETLHVPAIARVEGARVAALCDTDAGALDRAGRLAPAATRYRAAAELLADPLVEVVAICTPPGTHVALGLDALAAGKHVFIEKPLALNVAEAARLAEASREARAVTATGFNLRCHRLVEQAHDLVGTGAIGEARIVRSSWTAGFGRDRALAEWRRRAETGGGVLLELGSHCSDLWRYLLGDEVAEVAVVGADRALADEAVAFSARSDRGVVMVAALGEGVVDGNELELVGTGGRITLSLYRSDSLTLVRRDRMHGAGARIQGVVRRGRAVALAVPVARRGGDFLDSYRRQWERFVAAARGGSPSLATWDDGLAAARIAEAALRARDSGRREMVRCD